MGVTETYFQKYFSSHFHCLYALLTIIRLTLTQMILDGQQIEKNIDLFPLHS